MKNLLVVGAHYDDAELGAAGTMLKLIKQGYCVYKITLTDTEVFDENMNLHILGESAKKNSQEACQLLGVTEIDFPKMPYGQLEYSQESMRLLESLLTRYNIDTCIYHYSDDYNTDHLAANKICNTAFRHCNRTLMFQSNPYLTEIPFTPDFFVDVTDYIDIKRKALSCYESDHNRQGKLFEMSICRNEVWGYACHTKYAEGFKIVKYLL